MGMEPTMPDAADPDSLLRSELPARRGNAR